MKDNFSDKEYWKNRHSNKDNIKAVGVKGVSVKGNYYIYKFLQEQYEVLLSKIDISKVKTFFDCGFGDGYFLRFYKEKYPHIEISGIDISPEAKKRIDFVSSQNLLVGDLVSMDIRKTYDVVQSFDVLYHILNDSDYYDALYNMTKITKKYLVLHERFGTKAELMSSKHLRMRRSEYTNQILNSENFYLYREIPSHFLSMRLFTYRLNSYIGGLLYKTDDFIAKNLHDSTQERLASHFIRLYRRKSTL